MRQSAVVKHAGGLRVHDHAGWGFDALDAFNAAVRVFMADGLAAGQRIVYVGRDDAGLPAVPGFDDALVRDQARLARFDTLFADGTVIDPEEQVEAYRVATNEALADGFTGLRVAADSTSLVVTHEQRRAWMRYEFMIDRFMARHPMTGLCGFNRTTLGSAHVAEIECVHPVVNRAISQFRIHASTDLDVSGVLTGEVDPANRRLFAATLRRVPLAIIDGAVVLDTGPATFLDHRAFIELGTFAAEVGAETLIYAPEDSAITTLAGVLTVPGVRVATR